MKKVALSLDFSQRLPEKYSEASRVHPFNLVLCKYSIWFFMKMVKRLNYLVALDSYLGMEINEAWGIEL